MTFANNAVLGGHVSVGDFVFFGGQAAVHQFVRIGEGAMIGGPERHCAATSFRSDLPAARTANLMRPQRRRA